MTALTLPVGALTVATYDNGETYAVLRLDTLPGEEPWCVVLTPIKARGRKLHANRLTIENPDEQLVLAVHPEGDDL